MNKKLHAQIPVVETTATIHLRAELVFLTFG